MKHFPNGFNNWIQTHFEIVTAIAIELRKDYPSGKVGKIYDAQGTAGMYELAENLTDEFEALYEGKEWYDEYLHTIDAFISNNLK